MKKILGLVIASILLIGMGSIGTWAYFSDTETSAGNVLTAGTLDMVPATDGTGPAGKYTVTAGGNGTNGNVVFENLLPGEAGIITWVMVDNGSLGGILVITSTVTDNFSDVSQNEVENAVSGNNGGGDGDLDEYVGVKLQRGVGTDQASAETNFTYILGDASNYVPSSGLEAKLDEQSIAMAASGGNDTVVYKFSWSVATPLMGAGADGLFGTGDDTAVNDNIIQSDSAQIDITFTLNQ